MATGTFLNQVVSLIQGTKIFACKYFRLLTINQNRGRCVGKLGRWVAKLVRRWVAKLLGGWVDIG
jgi:hypothetical protein